jgi:hypothetical protein
VNTPIFSWNNEKQFSCSLKAICISSRLVATIHVNNFNRSTNTRAGIRFEIASRKHAFNRSLSSSPFPMADRSSSSRFAGEVMSRIFPPLLTNPSIDGAISASNREEKNPTARSYLVERSNAGI